MHSYLVFYFTPNVLKLSSRLRYNVWRYRNEIDWL